MDMKITYRWIKLVLQMLEKSVNQEEGAVLYFKNEVQFDMVVW